MPEKYRITTEDGVYEVTTEDQPVPAQPSLLRRAGDVAAKYLPVAGATAGGIIGLSAGPLGAVGGAGMGAMAGEAARQLIQPEESTGTAARRIAEEGVITGAGGELLGLGLTKAGQALAPYVKRGAQRTYQQFLGPTKEKMKGLAEKITPEALRRGLIGTREGVLKKAGRRAEAAGEAVGQIEEKIVAESAPIIIPRTSPIPKALPRGPIQLPPSSGAGGFAVVPAMQTGTKIVYLKNPQSGQLEFFAKPALGRREYQRVLWGPEFTGTSGESARLIKTYGAAPANPKELEDILTAKEAKSLYRNYIEKGGVDVPIKIVDKRPLQGLSDFFQVEDKYIDTSNILSALRNYRKQFLPGGVAAMPEGVRATDKVIKVVEQYGEKVAPETLIALRRVWDKPVARAGGFAGLPLREESLVAARKEGANAIRRQLSDEFPGLAKVNAEFSFWKNVEGILGETTRRVTGQSIPLGRQLMTAAGVGGGLAQPGSLGQRIERGVLYGTSANLFMMAVRSGAMKSSSAVLKDRLANAMARGSQAETGKLLARILREASKSESEKPAQ